MKSLIIKDLYNIGHNAKSMLFILLFFTVVFLPTTGLESYVAVCSLLCSMMIITTFSFDDSSHWTRFAMVMPISRKDLIVSKFFVLLIFSTVGMLFGVLIGTAGTVILHKEAIDVISLVTAALIGLAVSEVYGSMTIPLVLKFGAEKGRMLLLVSCIIPTAVVFGIYKLLNFLNIVITEQLLWLLPVAVIVWNYLMYRISYSVFSRKEL